jgi:hypothetical protein
MISARMAGLLAIASSIGSLLTIFFYMPLLLIKIGNINEQLKIDAEEFKALADESWAKIQIVKSQFPHGTFRARRQAYGGGGGELPKAYPLHNTYAKQDAFLQGPTCG